MKYVTRGLAFGICSVLAPSIVMAEADPQLASAAGLEEMIVYGQGETRQSQSISASQIKTLTPGTSAIKAIDQLPSVNFQSADPFGAYEWAVRITVRGFSQNRLGFTLDEVPLGDMSYGNHNGLHISRAILSDNLGSVELAQGSGILGSASASNLGGSVRFVSHDPSRDYGLLASFTGGTENTVRPFIRLETGELGEGGPRAFASYSYSSTDKWKGFGEQKYNQANVKVVQPVGKGEISAYYNFSDRKEQDYQDLSFDIINRLGYNNDNITNNYPLALAIGQAFQNGQPIPAPYSTVDDVYFDAAGVRRDHLGYVKAVYPFSDAFSASVTGYHHENRGQGSWITPYVPSPNGSPLSFRTTEYDIHRSGVVASGTVDFMSNELNAGVWYEDNNFNQARRFYQMGLVVPERVAPAFQSNPFFTQWQYAFNTETVQFHVQDTFRGIEHLAVNFGFKSLSVKNSGRAIIGTVGTGTIEAEDNFLPQVGLTYDIFDEHQVFASFSENMRAFVAAGTGDSPFSTTQAAFNVLKTTLKPEKSRTFEAGWRFNGESIKGVLGLYHVSFDNRLLVVSQGPGIVGSPNALSNVGGVTSQGVELGATWSVTPEWTLSGSYAYNDSTYDDNTVNGAGVVVATKGKTTVDAPKHLIKGSVNFDNEAFFGKLGVSFVDKRYYTYLNNGSVPSYAVLDLTLGYRLSGISPLVDGTEIQANITNLTDKKYVGTIGSNGFGNSDPTGTSQTLLAGAPLQAFFTIRKQF
jgi:iron complex outermembrane receptor protein